MASTTSTPGSQLTTTLGFMPGFLDELNRDEKILVLFAISFMLVFTGAAIGGIVCILSGSDNFYHKYWKRRRHDYQTEFADSKGQQASEYVASLGGNHYLGPSRLYGSGAPSYVSNSRNGRMSRSASESYLSNGPQLGLRRISGSQYRRRGNRSTHSQSPISKKRKSRRRRHESSKRFQIEHGRPYSQGGGSTRGGSSRSENGMINSAHSIAGDEYTGSEYFPVGWPYTPTKNAGLFSGYIPKATANGINPQITANGIYS